MLKVFLAAITLTAGTVALGLHRWAEFGWLN